MTVKIQTLLVVLLVVGALWPACAQYEEERPSKFGIKLVGFLPSGSKLRHIGSPWFGPAVDWYLRFDEDGRPTSYASVGLLGSGSGYVEASNYPVTYTKLHRRPISITRSSYTGYGAGIYRLNYRVSGYLNDTTWLPGLHVLYGQEFSDSYFAEVRFDWLPTKWRTQSWGGIYLNIGMRISM